MANGDRENARKTFAQQLENDPNSLGAKVNLARLDLDDGDTSAARQRYQQILDSNPNSLQGMLGMADVARREQKADELLNGAQYRPRSTVC